jgi:ribonuclease-3
VTRSHTDLDALQQQLGHAFGDPERLRLAITHPSYAVLDPEAGNNQRLELLGDAVIGLVVAETLYTLYPEHREGFLQQARAILVRGAHLAELATRAGLPAYLRLGPSEENSGGRHRPALLEDAFEAVVGAIYLDGGLDAARGFLLDCLGDIRTTLRQAGEAASNPKGALNEKAQRAYGGGAVSYDVVGREGDPPSEIFRVAVSVDGEVRGEGTGPSKRQAEEAAARAALEALASDPSE